MGIAANSVRGLLTALLVGATVLGTTVGTPAAVAEPPQQCTTVGESTSEAVQSYLDRHPDIKRTITDRAHAESPGSENPVLSYLERHPDVRQALITLANNCT